jgi:hypothetical protein
MLDIRDYDVLKDREEPPNRGGPTRSTGLWIVSALLIAAAVAAAYVVFGLRRTPSSAAPTPESVQLQQQVVQPLGGEAASIVLPPLDASDAVVRDLVKELSAHPGVAAWLATDGLIRNFTVVVANVAEGRTPVRHLGRLRPSSEFRVMERGTVVAIDPGSYERYDTVAAAIAGLDPQGSADLYATLKPRIEEAYRELGVPDTPFDRTLERAIVMLLRTPVLEEPVRVELRGIGYGFAAPDVEALPQAQKQLLRAGPRNVRVIQASLRDIALALGIAADRLPAQRN